MFQLHVFCDSVCLRIFQSYPKLNPWVWIKVASHLNFPCRQSCNNYFLSSIVGDLICLSAMLILIACEDFYFSIVFWSNPYPSQELYWQLERGLHFDAQKDLSFTLTLIKNFLYPTLWISCRRYELIISFHLIFILILGSKRKVCS